MNEEEYEPTFVRHVDDLEETAEREGEYNFLE